MGTHPDADMLYLWVLEESGIHSCYVANSNEKVRQFLESDVPPESASFLMRTTNEPIEQRLLGHLVELQGGELVASPQLAEDVLKNLSGRSLRYKGDVSELLNSQTTGSALLPSSAPPTDARNTTLSEAVEAFLNEINDRERTILFSRLTGPSARQTLEETSIPLGVTRERIRQIEAEVVKKFSLRNPEIAEATREIPQLLTQVDAAVSLRDLADHIQILAGAEKWWRLVALAAGRQVSRTVHLLSDVGGPILSIVTSAEFADMVRSQREYLKGRVEESSDYRVTELRQRIQLDLRLVQPGLVDLILSEVLRDAHTKEVQGEETVVSYGRGANAAVLAVLHSAPTPLTYEEVFEALNEEYELRRVHNALQEKAIQLGWGTYGLRNHIVFSDAELLDIAATAEEAIVADDPERQWHAQDIYDMVLLEMPHLDRDALSVYVVEYALSLSDELVSLRRLVWGLRSSFEDAASERIDRLELVESILEEAGEPLTNNEVKERADQIRGTGLYFQVYGGGRVVRVGRGKWGLRDRDVPWTDDEIGRIAETLHHTLSSRAAGMFMNEVLNLPYMPSADLDQTRALVHLVSEDDRFAFTQGGSILYLREWGEPRRLTLKGAIRSVFDGKQAALSREQLVEKLRTITGLPLESERISMALTTSSYCEFDASRSLWVSVNQ